jgi:hypothetical protein
MSTASSTVQPYFTPDGSKAIIDVAEVLRPGIDFMDPHTWK